jgi:hypothetical protein
LNYPTAADLRQAANEAILRRCDDPLLPEIMATAAEAASQGEMSCWVTLQTLVDDPRKNMIVVALFALGLQAYWALPPEEVGTNSVNVSWS